MKFLTSTVVVLLIITTIVQASVPIVKTSTWKAGRLMKTHGQCTFEITEHQRKGQWKVTVTTNVPTENIRVWIMKIVDKQNDGKKYELKSKYEYGPQTVNVQFRLDYKNSGVPLEGSCSSNVEPEEEATVTFTSNAPGESVLAISDIIQDNSWEAGSDLIMQGRCILPITNTLDDFYIALLFDQNTFGLTNWVGDEYAKDQDGQWYILSNKWSAHPSALEFTFHVIYDSATLPTGKCAILSGTNPGPITLGPTSHGPTQQPTTQQPTTQQPTQQPTTKQPTQQPTTKQPTTQQPTTQQPTQQSTQRPTKEPTNLPPSPTTTPVTGAVHQGILNLYKNKFPGDGTYYGKGESGTCSYTPPSLPPTVAAGNIRRLIALNKPQFFGSLACGMCFKVHGTGQGLGNDPITGDFIVFVKDLCPECHAGSIDLAEDGDGRWKVEIQAVQCPVGNTKLEYKFQGSNPWYLKLQIRNARIPVTGVQLWQPKSQRWEAMKHTSDAFWEMGSGMFEKPIHPSTSTPLKMKLTAANGAVVYDEITSMANEHVIHGTGKQIPLDSSLPHA